MHNLQVCTVAMLICLAAIAACDETLRGPIIGNCVGNKQLIKDFCEICGGSSAGLCSGNVPYACCQNTTSRPPKASPCSGCSRGYTLCNAAELCTKYKCVNNTCARTYDSSGVPKGDCDMGCAPSGSELYQCVNNRCVLAQSGVNASTCTKMCGPG
eukprot:m.136198 g.136198  ORF g.136198 m.136198 type:complete len:156 (+) comp11430_c1_seq1:71-538(+)